MSEEEKRGTIWKDEELDAIVSDYFAMLSEDISGRSYVKSRHSAVLMATIHRSHRSVEFKHQNISAVLDKLGLPWIPGYKPKLNFQNAIFDAIDRYLTSHAAILDPAPKPQPANLQSTDIFVPPPMKRAEVDITPQRLRQLVAKFDPVKRDHLNRALGKAGEAFVVDLERRKLTESDRSDLARKVRWTAIEDGDGAGYDVHSFTIEGHARFIEVKTTNGSARTPFFLTRNECNIAEEHPGKWQIYRVYLFASAPRIFTISPPLEEIVKLTPETWRASF